MAKTTKKLDAKPASVTASTKTAKSIKPAPKKLILKKSEAKRITPSKLVKANIRRVGESGVAILDHLYETIASRKGTDPTISHSARLLSRGRAKVAQKFGEEAVECLIEAVAGNRSDLIAESADVLYHLLLMWVDGDVQPHEVWAELARRQGVSGIAEKAARVQKIAAAFGLDTTKIP